MSRDARAGMRAAAAERLYNEQGILEPVAAAASNPLRTDSGRWFKPLTPPIPQIASPLFASNEPLLHSPRLERDESAEVLPPLVDSRFLSEDSLPYASPQQPRTPYADPVDTIPLALHVAQVTALKAQIKELERQLHHYQQLAQYTPYDSERPKRKHPSDSADDHCPFETPSFYRSGVRGPDIRRRAPFGIDSGTDTGRETSEKQRKKETGSSKLVGRTQTGGEDKETDQRGAVCSPCERDSR